jgi:hypothetical protein
VRRSADLNADEHINEHADCDGDANEHACAADQHAGANQHGGTADRDTDAHQHAASAHGHADRGAHEHAAPADRDGDLSAADGDTDADQYACAADRDCDLGPADGDADAHRDSRPAKPDEHAVQREGPQAALLAGTPEGSERPVCAPGVFHWSQSMRERQLVRASY